MDKNKNLKYITHDNLTECVKALANRVEVLEQTCHDVERDVEHLRHPFSNYD
jgi:hypothetical protein